jgi:hypothetical protein
LLQAAARAPMNELRQSVIDKPCGKTAHSFSC